MEAPARYWFLAVALAIVLFAGQALAISAAPAGGVVGTTDTLGRAGFAYLGGLRTFAAAVLWNRIDPQYHEYYSGASFLDLDFMMPTLALVQWLDPQFEQSYYTSSYFVARRLDMGRGIEIAREGLVNNPSSGLLTANLAQLLVLQDREKNLPEAVELSLAGLSKDARWANDDDRFEGYAVFRDVFRAAGDEELALRIEATMERMRSAGIGEGDHDHDGDGEQDH